MATTRPRPRAARLARLCLPGLAAGLLSGCGSSGGAASPTPVVVQPTPAPVPTATPVPAHRAAALRGLNGHSVGGTARVVRNGSGYQLELDQDFFSNGTTKVDVYLTRDPEKFVNGDLALGQIASKTGAQQFDMGTNDGTAYTHVLLWCRPFQITIGSGELK